jgi:uncharacterized protein (TIRG00374 family)
MAEASPQHPLSHFTFRRVLLPVAIGIAVSVYLVVVVSRIDTARLAQIPLSLHLLYGLLLAVLTVTVRDLAYIYRMWQLTDRRLSFFKCFEIIMLWEFGSSVTPASVGGLTAIYFISREKISFGKSASIVMLCSYMDNVAFFCVFSLLLAIIGPRMFDLSATCTDLGGKNIFTAIRVLAGYAWIGFIVVAATGGLLGFAIFIKPDWARRFLRRASRIRWLHRWSEGIAFFGEEIWLTSQEFKSKGSIFFLKVFIATSISWCARYALGNVMIWTFSRLDLNQLEVFARQCVLRVIIFIPATPGASGISELSFMALNCDYLPAGLAATVAIVWRLFNFYLYLGIGAIVLPRWIARVSKTRIDNG